MINEKLVNKNRLTIIKHDIIYKVGDNMDNKNIVIDINSIATTKLLMDSECDKLVALLNKYKGMFEETKTIYDTESATLYRTIATKYIDYMIEYINNNFKVYVNSLDDIKKTYVNEINALSSKIGGTE